MKAAARVNQTTGAAEGDGEQAQVADAARFRSGVFGLRDRLLVDQHSGGRPVLIRAWQQAAAVGGAAALALASVLALGLGTGYIGCMALVLGSERGNTPEEREALGMVTSFALMIGLSTGSTAGLGLSQLVLG